MTRANAAPHLSLYPSHAEHRRVAVQGVALEVLHLPGTEPDLAPLVFLHEGLGSVALWPQRGRCWPAELSAATGRSAWVYARQGYGLSDPIADVRGNGRHPPDYMHREARRTLPALLQTLQLERPVLVGHSDGATIALIHASEHPVTACVALAPHVAVEPVAIQAIAAARDAYLQGGLRERLARHHADVDNAFWQWNDVWLSEPFQAFDIRPLCAGIRAPLLLVQGTEDEYGTLAQLDWIQQAAPHAQRLELPGGHSPHRDHPDALTAAVAGFLHGLA